MYRPGPCRRSDGPGLFMVSAASAAAHGRNGLANESRKEERARSRATRATTRRTSPSSRDSRRCASARACTSAPPALRGPAPPDLRGDGQLGRRGAGRRGRRGRDRHPPGQQRHGHRQRPRHPRGHHGEGEAAGRRGRPDRAPRRRQVRRRRRLQGLGRPARRGRLGGQRALRVAPPHDLARRPRVDAVLRARHADHRAQEGREDRPARHAASRFLPDLEIFETIDYDRTVLEQRFREMAFLTKGLRIDFRDERGERFETTFQYDGGIVDFVNYLHSQGTREPLHRRSSTSRTRATSARSRWRCSGTTPTRRRSSRSPTTSTPTRAARTCPASARRSRARSTPTRARRASSRRRTPTSRARTSARASRRSSR